MRLAPSLALMLLASSCGTRVEPLGDVRAARQLATAENPYRYDFVMGATDDLVGEVLVWNDDTDLSVSIRLADGFGLEDAHLCVAADPFPWTPPGQCAPTLEELGGASGADFAVALSDVGSDLCDQVIHLQVHGSIEDDDGHAGSAYAGTFKGSVAYTVGCEPPPPGDGCTRSHGYWKHHAWPVEELVIGDERYAHAELLSLLKAPTKGDGSIILARQLIAARLNVAAGADTTADVDQALLRADAWAAGHEGRLPFGLRAAPGDQANAAAFDEAVSLGALFDRYNNGEVGPGHCAD
jgi:hypothetical protein